MTHISSGAPAVSVIIPAYNSAGTIAETLASVFAQSRDDFEVIVVDDGSDDGAALQSAMREWRPRIRFLSQLNRGAGAARNLGIVHARARLLAFLDADDAWRPELLERHVSLLRAHPEIDMVWSDGFIVGDTPLVGRTYLASTGTSDPPSFLSLVRQTCTVLTSSVVARTSVIRAVGGFDASIRRGQDFDLWLRLAHRGAAMAVRTEPLVRRRVHGTNLSGDQMTQLRRAIAVLRGIATRLPLAYAERAAVDGRVEALMRQLELELAKVALREGSIVDARRHLARVNAWSWKIRVAALGLRVAPDLLRRLYLFSNDAA